MSRFKDKNGREWSIDVTVNTLRRVKAKTEFMLTDLVTKDKAASGFDDPLKLFEILYWAVDPGISEEDFGNALDDAACRSALDALIEATIDFFPEPRRSILLESWQETRRILDEETAEGAAAAKKVVRNPAFKTRLRAEVKKLLSTSGGSSTNSPASSGSTQGRSRSTRSS